MSQFLRDVNIKETDSGKAYHIQDLTAVSITSSDQKRYQCVSLFQLQHSRPHRGEGRRERSSKPFSGNCLNDA